MKYIKLANQLIEHNFGITHWLVTSIALTHFLLPTPKLFCVFMSRSDSN